MNVRAKTGIIIQKDGEYLVGAILGLSCLRWSRSPYAAWITRRREDAEKVAKAVGGTRMLFNPIVGQLKMM